MASFDVLTEPWIPVRDRPGRLFERSMLDVLLHAHELDAD